MYAVFETGGKQYRVEAGDVIYVEKLAMEDNAEVAFDKVFIVGEEGKTTIGAPTVVGAKVVGKVLKTAKGKKITVFTYRSKKDSKRKMGHRQPYTKVEILSINV